MTLRARYAGGGALSGQHKSPFKGSSLEFSQHRQYSPGDEIRRLDWKIYGRSDRFYIKQYQEETNLRAFSVLDTSDSMDFSSGEMSKFSYASHLASALTYLLIRQKDSAGLITFSENLGEFIAPRNYKGHMKHIIQTLENVKPSGKTDLAASAREIGRFIKKRSLLIFFSDLYGDPEETIRILKYFSYMKNDIIVFHILDPLEISLDLKDEVEFIDMEGGGRLKTRPEVISKEYTKRLKKHFSTLERGMLAHSIQYCRLSSDTPLEKALSIFMEERRKIL